MHLYLSSYEAELRGGDLVGVLSLAADAAPGTRLTEDMLDVREIPERYLDERHIAERDLGKVEGTMIRSRVSAGDALLWSDLGLSEGVAALSELVPVGRRAVRLLGSDVSFGGLLRAGDRVDVLLTESPDAFGGGPSVRTTTLLEAVIVLAVGDEIVTPHASTQGESSGGAVTLSVWPAEAEKLESHRARGVLRLSLRHPEDLTLAAAEEADHVR